MPKPIVSNPCESSQVCQTIAESFVKTEFGLILPVLSISKLGLLCIIRE
jgi:hypothetical protein